MNSNRYIITRSCLEDGSMRLLKYNESLFPEAGAGLFIDEKGREFPVQVDRQRMLITGLGKLYHDHNLGVNDVMLIHPLAANRYQVELIVKPHTLNPAGRQTQLQPVPTERVVVSSTPHVREVRMQRPDMPRLDMPRPDMQARPATQTPAQAEPQPRLQPIQPVATAMQAPAKAKAAPLPTPSKVEDQVAEFARLTGYRLEYPASGLMRLHAELGPQYGYSVLLAADPLAMTQPAWEDALDEARLLLTHEAEQPDGLARLTREALLSLTEQARLAPLSPIDLRGYWRSGDLDLAMAASITELLSAHLAQRGSFTAVLLSLADQPAHSVIGAAQLVQRLGSGVNTAELNMALDTLTRPPFMALTPLPGGQYLLRASVAELTSELGEYAQGVRRRLQPNPQSTLQGNTAQHNAKAVAQAEQVLV